MANNSSKTKLIWMIAGILFVGYLLSSTLFSAMYTINSGTVGVLVTFGEFDQEEKTAGLHFKIPFVQDVRIFDIKMQTANYLGGSDGSGDGVINNPQIQVLDSKNLTIGLDLTVQYTPIAERANVILEQYGKNYFSKMINPVIRNIVRDVVGKYQAEDIALKRSEIGTELRLQLNKAFEEVPFMLNNVSLRNIELPPVVKKKIEEVQLAKQEEQRLEMVEKQARKEQQIKSIQADTRLIEVTTQAKAEAEQKRIASDAEAYQIMARAKANAEANLLLAKSLTPELIHYRSIEQWNGAYPQTMLSGSENNDLIFSLPQTGQ